MRAIGAAPNSEDFPQLTLSQALALCVLVASPAGAASLRFAGGAFLNDPGQAYPTDPRLQFDSRLLFRNTINGGAIAIGSEYVLHAYHAQFPATPGGVDGYVGRLMDQFDNDGNFLATYRVVASREDFGVDYAVLKVERLDGAPADLPVWVDPRELYPATNDIAVWGSFGPQSVTIGPLGEPIQSPPHPRGVKWGTIGADRASFPGLPSDVQEVPGDSGSGIFVRDGFNLRLAGVVGSALTPAVRQTVEQWVGQMGGTLTRYPLQVGSFATARLGGAGDWFNPLGWSAGLPTVSGVAWVDDDATVSVADPGATAASLMIGVGQHGLLGRGTLTVGTGGALSVGSLLLGVTEGGGALATGAVDHVAGVVSVDSAVIGYRGVGLYTHAGGTLTVTGELTIARDPGSAGSLLLSNAAAPLLSAGRVVVGREGAGTVQQEAGAAQVASDLILGRFEGGAGRYTLSGGSLSVGSSLIVGAAPGAVGTLTVSNGSATAAQLVLSRGLVELSGSGAASFAYASTLPATTLRVAGAELTFVEGGNFAGEIDFANAAGTLTTGGLTDLASAQLFNVGSASVVVRPGGLLVLPAGVSGATFGAVEATGAVVHTSGGTIEIGASTHLAFYGTLRDFVHVEGSLLATPGVRGTDITLLKGFNVAAGAALDLGGGGNAFVSVHSGNHGGVVRAGSMRVAGGATFAQSAGASELGVARVTAVGTIDLSGGTFTADSLELRGLFLQSGGTMTVAGVTELTGRFEQTGGSASLAAVIPTNPPAAAGASVSGGASLRVDSIRTATLHLADGRVSLDPIGVSNVTSVLRSLSMAGGGAPVGTLDLGHELLAVDYTGASPLLELSQAVAAARGAGAWAGPGITSSAAIASPSLYAVGIAEASELGATQFGDYSLVDPTNPSAPITAVLLRLTLAGDANLDGAVSIADFSRLAANFNLPGGWTTGDFDYDGTTGLADFALLAGHFNRNIGAAGVADGARVPEPATLGVAGSGITWALLHRRRRRPLR